MFKESIEQDCHMADIVHPDAEAFLASKKGFHILDAERRNAKQMISIGTSRNTCHLFVGEVTVERERMHLRCLTVISECDRMRRHGRVIRSFQLHTPFEREVCRGKKLSDKMGTIGQQPFDDVDIHFVIVPAGCTVAVYIPVPVYEILHVTAVQFAVRHDITEINGSCFREQCEKFFRYILLCNDVVQMRVPSIKKERSLLSGTFIF